MKRGLLAPPVARIELSGVSKRFSAPRKAEPPIEVLNNIDLKLTPGEFVCLLGPSGCGKSTILNLIAGFEQADEGRVLMDGRAIVVPGPDRGMVFQQPTLFPWLSVLDNVTFGPRMAGVPASTYLAQAERYLGLVGLTGFENHSSWQLSGGMRQRVALARAWLPNPEILLMDEPFGALDAQTRLAMQELLLSVWHTTGTTILFVTHDVDEALFLADRVLVMGARPGVICEEFAIPFPRPRDIETLVATPSFGLLKRNILHIVREQANKAMAGYPASQGSAAVLAKQFPI
jgi:NitT/TauT family transport system ATP-binding protein